MGAENWQMKFLTGKCKGIHSGDCKTNYMEKDGFQSSSHYLEHGTGHHYKPYLKVNVLI